MARPARHRRRVVASRPQGGSRTALEGVVAVGALLATSMAFSPGTLRSALSLVLVPLLPLAVTFVPAVWPRLAAQRSARRSGARSWKRPLAAAAKAGKPVVLVGRLLTNAPIQSPAGSTCAAWVDRAVDSDNVVQTSQVADARLATKRFGEVPLGRGRWRLANPFDPFDETGEASIAPGDAVLIRARVESVVRRGEGYRDNAVGYELRAAGGLISPRSGRFSRKVVANRGWVVSSLLMSLATFVVALAVTASSTEDATYPGRSSLVEGTDRETTASAEPGCGTDNPCGGGLVCDVETKQCVESIEGTGREGAACGEPGDCAAGLRCRPDLASSSNDRRCFRPCDADSDCTEGRWCVPCDLAGHANDGDCIAPSRLTGAVAELCKMLHSVDSE